MPGKLLIIAFIMLSGPVFSRPVTAINKHLTMHEISVVHKKKKKKCSKGCCKKQCDKPAAKDALKDRNTKDPNIDNAIPKVSTAIPPPKQ